METRDFTDIKKKVSQERCHLFYVDESTFELLPAVGRSYAPRGKTPLVQDAKRAGHLVLGAGISAQGKVYYQIRRQAFNGPAIVRFLKGLLKRKSKKVFLIWDGASVHRAKEVKAFLATDRGKLLHLFRLPPYCPELNACEQLWANLKQKLRNQLAKNVHQLHQKVHSTLEELKQQKGLIKKFFKHPEVTWVTA